MYKILHRIRLSAKPPAAATKSMLTDGTVTTAAFLPATGKVRIIGKNRICIYYDVCQDKHRDLIDQLEKLGWEPRYRPSYRFIANIHDLLEENLRDQAMNMVSWDAKVRYAHFACGGDSARQKMLHSKLWQRHMPKK